MTLTHRTAVRAAALVHHQLAHRRQVQRDVFLPDSSWARSQALLRQRDKARQRGWLRAAATMAQELLYEAGYLRSQLDHVIAVLDKQADLHPFPSQAEIYQEILGLTHEFHKVRLDLKQGHLSAITERLVLADTDLGPFEIRLELKRLGESPCYSIRALDPNPAGTDESVTHPHVQDGHLCEGEGHEAIQVALAEGRLIDFFLIVSRLLSTYNRGHAYIELSDWMGVSCSSCGETTRQRDAASCSGCDSWLCDDCRSYCTTCQSSYCSGCLSVCAACDDQFCNDCISTCDTCRRPVCSRCLAGGQCRTCRDRPSPTQESCHAITSQSKPENAAA
jgi:hypothetical protein